MRMLALDPGLRGGALENVYWGLLIATYPFISGLVAGSFVVASLSHVFKVHRLARLAPLALIVSFSLLLAAPVTVLADARQPVNAFELFTRPHIPWSPLGDFTLIWLSYVVLMTVETYFAFRRKNVMRAGGTGWRARLSSLLALGSSDLSERAERRDAKVLVGLSAIGILLAFLFHGYIGFVFGAVKARAIWSTALMPVLFIVSAVVSGMAFMYLVYGLTGRFYRDQCDRELTRTLLFWLVGFLALDGFLDVVDLVTSGVSAYTQGPVSEGVSSVFLHGPHAFSYLGLQLGVGIVLPLLLFLVRPVRRSVLGGAAIALCVVVGVYAMRYNVVLGGQMESKVSSSIVHMSVPLTGFDSVQTVLGVFAIAVLLFLFFSWLLPWREAAARDTEPAGTLLPAPVGTPSAPSSHRLEPAADGRARFGRRAFLARTGMVSGGVAVASWGAAPWVGDLFHRRGTFVYPDRPATLTGVSTIYSVCKQCGSDCGLAAEVFGGVLQKLDGNPYHPASTEPHARYATPAASAAVWATPHSLCNRGQAGRQTVYDPYRLTLPLKRSGPRGSGRFEAVSWEQLVDEVVAGGTLFSAVAGEERRQVEGFAGLYDHGRGRYRPIDPADPGLGPETNGLVVFYGMAENGQTDLLSRFASSFGTVNLEAADAVCDLPRMKATMLSLDGMTDPLKPDLANAQYVIFFGLNPTTGGFPMQALGRKVAEASASRSLRFVVVDVRANNSSMYADRCVYVRPGGDGALAMGMIRSIIEQAAYDAAYLSCPSQEAAAKAGMPSFTNATWLVVSDPQHPRYGSFLTPAEAGLSPEKMGGGGGSSMGLASGSGQAGVVIDPSTRVPVPATGARSGELWPAGALDTNTTVVNGVRCATGFQLLYGEARALSLEQYATQAGVPPELIATLAAEFTSYGRQAVADYGRGPAMHTNGFYACRAVMTLNFLVGSLDWMGGYVVGGGTADYAGGSSGAPYALGSWPGQPANVPAGVPISRSGVAYETSGEYAAKVKAGVNPYPARRPWFPFGGGQWPEMFAGIREGYPYGAKIVLSHAANPAWSAPAIGGCDDPALPFQRLITDLDRVPLFIATDIVMSETAVFADYVVPDTTFLESWEFPGVWPVVPTKAQGVRQPVIEPLTGHTASGYPMCMEQFLIDVAKALGLPGFGEHAFAEGGSLDTREDYYLKMVANVAYDPTFQAWRDGALHNLGPVPNASRAELAAVAPLIATRRRAIRSSEWPKVAYVLARGGRFEDYEVAYLPSTGSSSRLGRIVQNLVLDTGLEHYARATNQISPAEVRASFLSAVRLPANPATGPAWMTYRYGQGGLPCQLYNPDVATTRNSLSGERFCGTARFAPMTDLAGRSFEQLDPASRFPFVLSTHKSTILSHSQCIVDPWLTELMPEGFIDMCPSDAARRGFEAGDLVRVYSATLPRERAPVGRLRLLPGVRPGVVAFPHGYGHWQSGAASTTIDGSAVGGDATRGTAVRLNSVIRLDTSLAGADGWTVGCMDAVTGGQAYFETRVAVERI